MHNIIIFHHQCFTFAISDLASIAAPSLISIIQAPLVLFLYPYLVKWMWPTADTPPNVNDAISCFLTPAGKNQLRQNQYFCKIRKNLAQLFLCGPPLNPIWQIHSLNALCSLNRFWLTIQPCTAGISSSMYICHFWCRMYVMRFLLQ